MQVASLRLCKELYELSWWGNNINGDSTYMVWRDGLALQRTYFADGNIPAYDLGYLIGKLPEIVWVGVAAMGSNGSRNYRADYERFAGNKIFGQVANTPEDAVAKLCVHLFKQGIL